MVVRLVLWKKYWVPVLVPVRLALAGAAAPPPRSLRVYPQRLALELLSRKGKRFRVSELLSMFDDMLEDLGGSTREPPKSWKWAQP